MEIMIGAHEYKVIYQDIVLIDGESALGKIDITNGIIHIANTQSKLRQYTTLIHEVVHGILDEIGNPFVELMDEEHFVKPFANVLSQVLINNEFERKE